MLQQSPFNGNKFFCSLNYHFAYSQPMYNAFRPPQYDVQPNKLYIWNSLIAVQWRSEYQTIFKWSKVVWSPNGQVFKCHLNTRHVKVCLFNLHCMWEVFVFQRITIPTFNHFVIYIKTLLTYYHSVSRNCCTSRRFTSKVECMVLLD